MAETLSTTDLLANSYEPLRKFRWVLAMEGLDAYVLKTAARPQATFDEITVDYINTKRFLSGKMTWNPIDVTMNDPVVPSAAAKVLAWVRRNYEPLTGRMGYAGGPGASDEAKGYKQRIQLKMLDPQGTVCELWDLDGAWPMDINFGDLDMSSSDPVEISMTIRFDNATKQY